jgi:membrane peptidoglycan carboxypeptidase
MLTAEIGNAGISWNRAAKTVEGVGSCEAWVAALPDGLREPLEGFTFTGKVDFKVNYGNKPSVTIKGGCYAKCDSKKIKALHKPFHYMVYSAKNELVDRVSGPNSKDWTPLGVMALTLPTAVITMEDPGFVYHRGFVVAAYRNSLLDNLKLGRFHRGGSTISMQLAKNLWLRRDKTLGRKAQEFFLAQALESCFSKDQILELYLNVVEFGLDLYGVGPAAQRYFGVPAEMLSPVQAYWLASILPRPRSAVPPNEAALERIGKLMSTLESSRSSGRLDAIGTTP